MSEYPLLSTLVENKIIDRRILKMVEKIFQKAIRGAKLNGMSEFKNGRFRGTIEGQVTFPEGKELNASMVKKVKAALEELAFDEFIDSGQTVMGAEIEGDTDDRDINFVIELDQD